MDPILLIFVVIALLAVTALCVVAIMWIVDLKKQVAHSVAVLDSTSRDVSTITQKLVPVLEEAKTMMMHAGHTFEQADIELEKIGRGADTFIAIAQDIRQFEQHLIGRIQGPLDDATSVVTGVLKGVSTFARTLFKRGGTSRRDDMYERESMSGRESMYEGDSMSGREGMSGRESMAGREGMYGRETISGR